MCFTISIIEKDGQLITLIIYCPQKVGDIGTQKKLEIRILICRINNFVFGYSIMSASFPA